MRKMKGFKHLSCNHGTIAYSKSYNTIQIVKRNLNLIQNIKPFPMQEIKNTGIFYII